MTTKTPEEAQTQIVNMVREFVRREVEPIASEYEREDIVPLDVIEKMKEMGLFGITVPEEYGGMGLDCTTFAMIFEELSKGWMSIPFEQSMVSPYVTLNVCPGFSPG